MGRGMKRACETALSYRSGTGLRVGLLGLFGSGNFGNDGSLKAMHAQLERVAPDAQFTCFCDGPERVNATFGITSIAMSPRWLYRSGRLGKLLIKAPGKALNLLRAIKHTRKLDVLVVPGTGILDDYCSGPLAIPVDVFVWCLAARITRTPVWFASIGAGPIVNPVSRWLMVQAAKMADYRSYRDFDSKVFLQNAGVDTSRDCVFPDLAFGLAFPRPQARSGLSGPPTVAIGVMNYRGWHNARADSDATFGTYQERLCQFCLWLIDKGYRVRLLPGDEVDGVAVNALKWALAARLPEAKWEEAVIVEPAHNLAEVLAQMAQSDAVVASRFHNVVCALKAGRPTLSLCYAPKNAALLSEAGLGNYVHDVEEFEIERLKEQLVRLMDERETLARSIAAFNALTSKRLRFQEQLLQGRLGTDELQEAHSHEVETDAGFAIKLAAEPMPATNEAISSHASSWK